MLTAVHGTKKKPMLSRIRNGKKAHSNACSNYKYNERDKNGEEETVQ